MIITIKNLWFNELPLLPLLLLAGGLLVAEEGAGPSDEAQANNPLANFKAFNTQNYYIPEISGLDETANAFWLRYAQPFGKWLFRGSLPFNRVPVADGLGGTTTTSGMGNPSFNFTWR